MNALSKIQYIFHNKDPRRVQPLVNYINKEFQELDFNTGLAFDAVKILSLFRALYEELKRKFIPWSDETVERCWDEISSEHDEVGIPTDRIFRDIQTSQQVRAMVGEILAFTEYIMVIFLWFLVQLSRPNSV